MSLRAWRRRPGAGTVGPWPPARPRHSPAALSAAISAWAGAPCGTAQPEHTGSCRESLARCATGAARPPPPTGRCPPARLCRCPARAGPASPVAPPAPIRPPLPGSRRARYVRSLPGHRGCDAGRGRGEGEVSEPRPPCWRVRAVGAALPGPPAARSSLAAAGRCLERVLSFLSRSDVAALVDVCKYLKVGW